MPPKTTILLVDDEKPFVDAMSRRLTRRGFDVLPAFDGTQALARLDECDTVDVVVLDVKMPGLDGLEVLQMIRARHPLVEVIMLTGHGTVEAAIQGMKLGAFDFLLKPSDIDELTAKVQEARDKKSGHKDKILQAQAVQSALDQGGEGVGPCPDGRR
jgi:DNA-binding NtrC family response regulator